MKTDSLFYRLFQADPALAFELAGIDAPDAERYRFVSLEVKQTAFRLDGVLEPPADRPEAPLVFVEAQAQPDDGFYLRFLGEALLYLRQYPPVPVWRAVVFYPDAATERVGPGTVPFLHLPNLHRVHLNELPLLASPNPKLWLIALILADERQIPGIVEKVENHRRGQPDDRIDWLDWLETILIYKLPRFTREEIQAMFNFTESDLKRTVFYQQVFGEGKVAGQVEGRVEGRAEGEAVVLRRLLERRFGPLPANAIERLDGADADTLLTFADRVLDAATLDEVWGQ